MAVANVNGLLSPLEDAKIPISDRGFLYGDSIYEVVIVENGVPMFLEDHFERMKKSAAKIELKITQTNKEIKGEISKTLKFLIETTKNECKEIYVR